MSPDSTIWGLSALDIHDRFWASRGVQVVRPAEPSAIVPLAELYLLLGPGALTIFRPAAVLDAMSWLDPDIMVVRLTDSGRGDYTESIRADAAGRFLRFERRYGGMDSDNLRVGLTSDPEVARIWQAAPDAPSGWKRLRSSIKRSARATRRLPGRFFDADRPGDSNRFLREIVRRWRRPDAVIDGIRSIADGVWAHSSWGSRPLSAGRGPLWIGAGQDLAPDSVAIGPAVIFDSPSARPEPPPIHWLKIEPIAESLASANTPEIAKRPFKRPFDILFSLVVLTVTLPLYPFIALAIILEDGWPVFFSHRRETLGGKPFGCLKFRSMRRDADQVKSQLAVANRADGPQFFIPDDPRLTRVGRVLRDFQLDELPQFINVLRGDMSVVGPRPSPFKENQYCPAWREARLSVRPGVTGLWQIRRTRAEGTDFQEWIKYDIEYVERESLWLDFMIIWKTVLLVLRKVSRL
jgi:lipopolysaccharide/colanic/teichoic acid biosynthesis glycosyltransferase